MLNIYKQQNIENIDNTPYPNKSVKQCNFQIPAYIFQTWESKKIPPLMLKNILNIKLNNPNFKYFLFDDNDCREFIKYTLILIVIDIFILENTIFQEIF